MSTTFGYHLGSSIIRSSCHLCKMNVFEPFALSVINSISGVSPRDGMFLSVKIEYFRDISEIADFFPTVSTHDSLRLGPDVIAAERAVMKVLSASDVESHF